MVDHIVYQHEYKWYIRALITRENGCWGILKTMFTISLSCKKDKFLKYVIAIFLKVYIFYFFYFKNMYVYIYIVKRHWFEIKNTWILNSEWINKHDLNAVVVFIITWNFSFKMFQRVILQQDVRKRPATINHRRRKENGPKRFLKVIITVIG